jgi:glutaminase
MTASLRTGFLIAALALATACASSGGSTSGAAAPAVQPVARMAAPATLPDKAELERLVAEAHAKFAGVTDGKNANYIPALDEVPSHLFGVAIVTVAGDVITAGDTDYAFSIQSVSKPFTMAHVMNIEGYAAVQEKIGVEPTGMPFNSKIAIELIPARSVNPMVNAGALASVSMIDAKSEKERWQTVLANLEAFAGEKLTVLEDIYESEYTTAFGNRAIANLLFNYQRLYADPEETLRVYTRQCSVGITAKQLGVMGATLANGGVNPVTGNRVLQEEIVPKVLAVMQTAGFYDESGQWTAEVGLPSKTGVGGGIVTVVPGQMAIVGFSPPLNEAGNSVRAQLAIKHIANAIGANVFAPR